MDHPAPQHARRFQRFFPSPAGRWRCVLALAGLLLPAGALMAQSGAPPYPGYQQPEYQQPEYQQPGYSQPAYSQQQYPQPGYPQPAYQQPAYQEAPGYSQQQPAYAAPYGQQPAPPPPDAQYPAAQGQYPQGYNEAPQQQQQQALGPDQMEQLIAPIALYPDTLLAQVLAASTYPAQVADADHWRQAQGNAPPEAIAEGADAQPWDPSVKALTAFPQVLAEMDANLSWTTELGNAYYNQPDDLMNAVQDLRQRAAAAGTLQDSPQETVSENQGYMELAPANPNVVYVPSYNPWTVYGQPVAPYPGFNLLGAIGSFFGSSPLQFGVGTVLSAFMPMSWGWMGWGLNWLAHCLFFHNSGYYPRSASLADWGLPHGGPRAYWGRGEMAHGFDSGGGGYNRGGFGGQRRIGYGYSGSYREYGERGYAGRGYAESSRGYGRNSQEASIRMPAFNRRGSYGYGGRNYGRSSYGSSAYGRSTENYGRGSYGRTGYGRLASPVRYSGSRSYGRTSAFGLSEYGRQSRGGGFFGGSRSSNRSEKQGMERAFAGSERSFGGGFSGRSSRSSGGFGGRERSGGSRGFSRSSRGSGRSHFGGGHFGGHGGGHRR